MATPLKDLSALKSLKKELQEKESALDPKSSGNRHVKEMKINMEPKRKRVRQMPSKEEVLGAQKAKELGLEPGMKVTLMDTKDKGVIKRICPDHAEIEIEGLIFPVRFNDFIVNDIEQDRQLLGSVADKEVRMKKKESGKQVRESVPSEIDIDLHMEKIPGGYDAPEGFELAFQMEYFKTSLLKHLRHRGMRINFIHGVGDGILKDSIRKEIEQVYALRCSWAPGIPGVTIVTIK